MSLSFGRRPLLAALPLASLAGGRRPGAGRPAQDEEGHLHDQELQARERHRDARGHDRLRDLRHPGAGWPQRRAADPRLHVEPAHGRPLRRERRRGLVGRAGRTGQGDRHRPAVRRVVEHAGLVLRLDQSRLRQSRHRQALRPGLPRHHPGRHRQRPEGAARRARREAPGRGRRAVVRRLPDLPVGRHPSRLHGRAGGRGQRAQGLGRRGGGEVAGRLPGQGSQLERRPLLRQGRRHAAS